MADEDQRRPRLNQAARDAKAARQRRLAQAMRENLAKRKAQQRAAGSGRGTPPADPEEPEPG